MALTLERIYPQERGQASGIIWMGAALGIIISGLIAPPIIGLGTHGGWRLVWIVMGLAGVIIAFGFFVTGRVQQAPLPSGANIEASPIRQALWATLRPLLLPRRLLWLSLAYFGFGGGYIMYLTFFITLLEKQGIPTLYAGFVWAAIGMTAALSAWIWGRIFDHWPTGFTVAVALACGACGSLAVLTNTPAVEYIGAAIVGLSALTAPPIIITVLLKRAVPDAEYAVSYSTLTAIFAIGQILGPFFGGFVIERLGLEAGIATSALLLGVATLCACGYGLIQRKN
jgi:predicted MFS family arabinose efflux permease